ncbi:hypothetical protein AAFF_G00369800 [Aldrovandia affinis]|uniref:Uncharacterized protein n=1 Tax=Aldrovandia affinis TaxID=143900 RepID=A0AAD7VZ01_9TELE|nr:hypothetical protein AAFF_G00369800 [Aldrovandia affinis]
MFTSGAVLKASESLRKLIAPVSSFLDQLTLRGHLGEPPLQSRCRLQLDQETFQLCLGVPLQIHQHHKP